MASFRLTLVECGLGVRGTLVTGDLNSPGEIREIQLSSLKKDWIGLWPREVGVPGF
jgi:hypothetical protein